MKSMFIAAVAPPARARARATQGIPMINRPSRKAMMLSAVLMFAAAVASFATVPSTLNFQGKLLDASNNPRNGTFSLTFKIYDAPSGGNLLWSETQSGVTVSNGVFAVQLGSVTPIPVSAFSGASTYLEITVGTEVGSPRQALASSPYAFKAALVDSPLPAGDTQYIQVGSTLQTGATFYVSSGTVAGPLVVGGVIAAGSGGVLITTPGGQLDASKLSGVIPSAQLSGTYSNALTLGNAGNILAGDGTNIANVTAAHLASGELNYVQNRATLQAGTTFYVSSGTVGGTFIATGTVSLGGAAGVNDVTVASNLTVNGNLTAAGAGPHVFGGNVQVKGNNLADSAGVNRITLGATNVVNGNLGVPAGTQSLNISTNVALSGTANKDNFIAFPFTAGTAINNRDALIITGANQVGTTNVAGQTGFIGIAVNSAAIGQTVYVAMYGIVTGVTCDSAITAGSELETAPTTGRVEIATSLGQNTIFGKNLTSTTAAGQKLTVILMSGY